MFLVDFNETIFRLSILTIYHPNIMKRKDFIQKMVLIAALPYTFGWASNFLFFKRIKNRIRPNEPEWPSTAQWEDLRKTLKGQLTALNSPFEKCNINPTGASCKKLFKKLKNPFYISSEPALTQTSGWLHAWSSIPSTYAIEAENTSDVVKGVNFARKHNLRLVIKGGAHSYQGRSSSEDSLLIWTRKMNNIKLHDDFIPQGNNGNVKSQSAVSVDAGAIWMDVYNKVTTEGGRYVQGGGCTTVGVAGLIQSGGFGSFSKRYGLAAAGLLEAEVVTADGEVLVVNEYSHPDLFWALKGGGGGSFGIVTRLTLKTRELPDYFGGVFGTIKADSKETFRSLINKLVNFYNDQLHNSKWGEQIVFKPDNSISIQMVFQGLTQEQAEEIWQPLQEWVYNEQGVNWTQPLVIAALPARHFWDVEFLKQNAPNLIIPDQRSKSGSHSFSWAGDQDQVGWYLYGFHSTWLPKQLLEENKQEKLIEALFIATRFWSVSLHFNKGLSGAPKTELEKAKNTAMNPAVLDAFALALVAGSDSNSHVWSGIEGYEPDLKKGEKRKEKIDHAMDAIYDIVPQPASYFSESDYFEKNWQESFWGSNYKRLSFIKEKYDPEGLFYIHHGVGSEKWTDNGFKRRE